MTLPLWKTIDRFDLKSAVAALCERPDPGLLVVVADDDSDRAIAADVAAAALAECGLDPIRVREAVTEPATLRQILSSAWEKVEARVDPTSIPRSVGESKFMDPRSIVDEIAACCVPVVGRSFVFDTVDRDDKMHRSALGHFVRLAQCSRYPVVVFSRKESQSQMPREAALLGIGGMPLWEVKVSLKTAPVLATIGTAEMDALLGAVDEVAEGDDTLAAYDAYSVVEDALRGIQT